MKAKSLKSSQILRAHMPYFRRPGHIYGNIYNYLPRCVLISPHKFNKEDFTVIRENTPDMSTYSTVDGPIYFSIYHQGCTSVFADTGNHSCSFTFYNYDPY